MWFLSDFYISTDFGQPVRSIEAHRVRGFPHRHDACYAVFSSVSTQDGGKHNAIPKTGLQVSVAAESQKGSRNGCNPYPS